MDRSSLVHPRLLKLKERVALTPHIGTATIKARRALVRIAVDNVLYVLAGRPPETPVRYVKKGGRGYFSVCGCCCFCLGLELRAWTANKSEK